MNYFDGKALIILILMYVIKKLLIKNVCVCVCVCVWCMGGWVMCRLSTHSEVSLCLQLEQDL